MKTVRTRVSTMGFIVLLLACAAAWAQTPAEPAKSSEEPAASEPAPPPAPPLPGSKPGTIGGRVLGQGVPLAGATITVTHETTSEKQTIQTNAQGDYEIQGLAPGTYMVRVDASGFKSEAAKKEAGGGPQDFYTRGLMAWEPLFPIFQWAYATRLGLEVRESTWAVAYLEVFHLLGITVLLGSVIALSLRLAGLAMRSLPPAEVAREIRPYMLGGLALVLASGIPIFASEAEKMFQSRPFELKMFFFATANIFQFTAVAMLIRSPEGSRPVIAKLAALLAVVFWYVVAWEGRAIAFF